MLYTASWKRTDCFHGEVICISLKAPSIAGLKLSHLELFKPTKGLLDFWYSSNKSDEDWAEYERRYWALLAERRPAVMEWIEAQKSDTQDKTLCCYELSNRHCHRRLVQGVINKYLPGLWGGDNILYVPEYEPESPPSHHAPEEASERLSAKSTNREIAEGSRVLHTRVDKGPGTVLWVDRTLAYVIWDNLPLGAVQIVQHPTKHENQYNRMGDPLPFPVSLLKLAD